MKYYFGIPYEFDRSKILQIIREGVVADKAAYVCVADGVVLATCQVDSEYRNILSGSMLNVCDSSYVPIYIRCIYGHKYISTSGEWLFLELLGWESMKMAFIGSTNSILTSLKQRLISQSDICNTLFAELPFCKVEEFDYSSIAQMLNRFNADIIWVSLGAPKQERFIANLAKYLTRGVVIAVGAVFGYQSGNQKLRRAPRPIITFKLEFLYRLLQDPEKQWGRCSLILRTLPKMLLHEFNRKSGIDMDTQ
ncbi:MAG: WecB/TagA/CpsF family glycosyltransferase [Bacteroides sp.]|nr:WecB/TagA/CpsF family glycosyltransferase [Bacteroides sp.]